MTITASSTDSNSKYILTIVYIYYLDYPSQT